MAKSAVLPRLVDIATAINNIGDAIDGKDFAEFKGNVLLQAGVERFIERISEASRHLPLDLTDRYPQILCAEIRAIGNILRHHYQHVAADVIWKTATTSIPELKPVIAQMIAMFPPPPKRKKKP
jgi:uncharacterized protein with HEPN domain